MKKTIFVVLLTVITFNMAFAETSVKYKVETSKSKITWDAQKVGTSHEGTIMIKSGELIFKNNILVGGTFIIDMTTIEDTDLTDKAQKDKLVAQLKGVDFFDVAKFPEAKFEITNADRKLNQDYLITGKLSIRDKSDILKIPVSIKINEDNLQVQISAIFDRTKFGIKYGSEKFFKNLGDNMISDYVDIFFTLNATRE